MFSDEDVSREFGNNKTWSGAFMDLIQDFYHLKE